MKPIQLGKGAEFDLIRRILEGANPLGDAELLPEAVRVGPGDDCAVVRGEGITLSVDMSVEDVHFQRDWLEPEEIGYRATAAALSDLAATAATPIGVLVSLATRQRDADEMVQRIMHGASAAAAGANAMLLGGDITRTDGPLVIDVVVIGNALRPVLRRGARAGDTVWVTGELGAAAVAVQSWRAGRQPEPAARLAFALPAPRLAEAAWLAGRGVVNAMIDLSDGLAGDIGHIAAASGVRILLDAAGVPIHPTVHAVAADNDEAVRIALSGGDDYELCFTAPAGAVERLRASFVETFDLPLTPVGSVLEGTGVFMRGFDGRTDELRLGGYDHLAPRRTD
jgi:thiamine-monophosphate kinase